MKKRIFLLSAIAGALVIGACDPGEKELEVSQELKKIETTWDGISAKEENTNGPKTETTASAVVINEMKAKVQQEYNAYLQKSAKNIINGRIGNWVGVIKNSTVAGSAGCNGYDELEINMDCEDNNSKTGWLTYDPYFGSSSTAYTYRPGGWDIHGNATFRFCLVPGYGFHPFLGSATTTFARYAVLRVTTNLLPDAQEASRRFDNEDRRNANSAFIRRGSQTINVEGNASDNDNSVYSTLVNDNTYMSFHVFWTIHDNHVGPNDTPITEYPDFGFSYGVFGENAPKSSSIGLVKVDDEDNNNANYYFSDESDSHDQTNLWYTFQWIIEGRNGDRPSGNNLPISGRDTYVFIANVK